MTRQIIDMRGQRFGALTVQEITAFRCRTGGVVWKCLCACGNTAYLSRSQLYSHHRRSCGRCKTRRPRTVKPRERRQRVRKPVAPVDLGPTWKKAGEALLDLAALWPEQT